MAQLFEATLDQHTDCVEACADPGRALLAVGTYQLEEARRQRHGSLRLLSLARDQPGAAVSRADTAGVLDLRWASATLLQLATAAGEVETWEAGPGGALRRRSALGVAPGSICLALDLDPQRGRTVCSAQAGTVALLQDQGGEPALAESWQAHEAEVWTCAFGGSGEEDLVLTGADDSCLRGWDLRAPKGAPAFNNRRGHGAGVCCVRPCPWEAHAVATGSYDERLRLWDLRQLSAPTQSVALGGGVWCLQWHPTQGRLLAAACMHNGYAVLHAGPGGELAIRQQGLADAGLLYGVAWCPSGPGRPGPALATCRFYEAKVTLFELGQE